MRWRMFLVVAAVGLAACAPADDAARVEVRLGVPEDATPEAIDAALAIIGGRFGDVAEGVAVEVVRNDDGTVTMDVTGLADTARVVSLISARGEVSFRPVMESHPTSPMIGSDAPEIEPETGLTIEDDIDGESWLPYEDSLGRQVLRVGPAGLDGSNIEAVLPYPVDESGTWAVNVEMSDEGADAFAEMSGRAAAYPLGDPRRQIAIVLDGVVISAPVVSPDVLPEVGITGGLAQIAMGQVENARDEAHDLASVLGNEALPITFEVIEVIAFD